MHSAPTTQIGHAIIAYAQNDTWIGLPVDFDTYLTRLGKYLFTYLQPLVDRHDYMQSFLFRHVAGFISIMGTDLGLPAQRGVCTWLDLAPATWQTGNIGVACYCHSCAVEPRLAWHYGHEPPPDGCFWAYVVSDKRFTIFGSARDGDSRRWQLITSLSFADTNIDWAEIALQVMRDPITDPAQNF
jgi:hypothetical protein